MNYYESPKTDNLLAENIESQIQMQHSKLGLISLLIGVILFGSILSIVGWIGYLETTSPGSLAANETMTAFFGFAVIGCTIGVIVNTCFCIYGLFKKNRKHTYTVASLTLNIVLITLFLAIIILGVLISSS